MRRLPLLLLALSGAALAGCGDTFVDPFLRDAGAISVYGVLEAGLANEPPTEQTLRVQNVRTSAEPPRSPDDPALDFPATVVTVDTFTGDSLRWDRRRTQFPDGTYGDLFSATFRPRPGGRYDLVVRRGDDRTATSRLTIPATPEGEALPFEQRGERVLVPVAWQAFGIDRASAVVDAGCGVGCGATVRLDDLPVRALADGRFAVDVDLSEAFVRAAAATTPDDPGDPDAPPPTAPPLRLGAVRVTARLLGPEWARADDPTQTTIVNGYGFVGGASRVEIFYDPSDAAARAAGFVGS